MRWAPIILALLLISGTVFAGRFDIVGTTPRLVWLTNVRDATITVSQYAAPCTSSPASLRNGTDGRVRCYVPKGWSLEITHVGLMLSEDVDGGGAGNCLYVLSYSADGTGTTSVTDVTDSDLYTDESFDCDGRTKDLDVQGESCVRSTAPLILTEGAWVHWKVSAGTVGTCTTSDTYLEVYGEWRKNG